MRSDHIIKKTLVHAAPVIAMVIAIALSIFAFPQVSQANPADAVPPTEDGSVGIYSPSGNTKRDPDDNTLGIGDEQVREEQGRVSQLSVDTHNPYNGQIRLLIDLGSEFADYEGCEVTEGYVMTVSPGGTVKLPSLRARDGYYFVGWGQGGVPEEPTWDVFTTEVEMDTDTSNGKSTTIFALFANDEGDGYCTCGAYEAGVYADKLDEIKANNSEYNDTLGYKGLSTFHWKMIACAVLITLCAACLIVAARKDYQEGKAGDTEFL